MAKTDYQSVDQYLKQQPDATRKQLERVRRAIQKAVPRAEEAISYQIPAFKLDGRALLYFAGWKEHYSLYPATAGVVARFGKELKGYLVSKGTLRFPLSDPVPSQLIAGIASQRASEVAELAARKGSRTPAKKSGKKAIQQAAAKAKPTRASAAKRKSG
jgi:uncharacterized protein YdhG (YjbR/CyaY superfamily)